MARTKQTKRRIIIEEWLHYGETPACARCSPYIGRLFERGTGPQPVRDTHPGCRCERVVHHVEWR